MHFSFIIVSVFIAVTAFASGPIPKYGEALCRYQDHSVDVDFEFYIAKFQDSYDLREFDGHRYYVSVTPEREVILVGVTPMNSQGQIDGTKSIVGKGFNTVTRLPVADVRGDQTLVCDPI